MPRYMIKRTLPPLTPEQLEGVRQTSSRVAHDLKINWIRSHITADGKFSFCEYEAENEDVIRQHSKNSGIPYDEIIPLGLELGPSMIR